MHHSRLTCKSCGAFIRWLPKSREHKGDLPPTEKQRAFLRQLGHDGSLATRLEASDMIEALKARRN